MQALARLERAKGRSRRTTPRLKLSLGSNLSGSDEEVVIHDLSSTGMLIQTGAKLRNLDHLAIELPEVGDALATIVWTSGDYFGCQFDKPISKGALSAAQLRNPFEPAAAQTTESAEAAEEFEDDRAPLTVRLRVIFGSTILLWALILWALGLF